MEICGHCHNVLPKSIDRCTVCGTARVDPNAADVRRRDGGDVPAHAPGWAAPSVPETGIHPDDFVRELHDGMNDPFDDNNIGDDGWPIVANEPPPIAPARAVPVTPPTGALAGYLGSNIERAPQHPSPSAGASPVPASAPPPSTGAPDLDVPSGPSPTFDHHLSTATKVAPDGVAARTTRLDGTVKLGPTKGHRLVTLGVPLAAGVLLVGAVLGSYRVASSDAAEAEAAEEIQQNSIDTSAVTQSSSAVVTLDLDGCGIIDRTTGFLFADQNILVPRSAIKTDARPTVVLADGTEHPAVIIGWSLTRDLAVVRTEDRVSGGLRWGVSGRVAVDDVVSVLAVNGPGAAMPVPATVTDTSTINGANVSFELDAAAAAGSMVLNSDGFVVGVIDDRGTAQVSDDLSPAISRIVLDNDRPASECPPPPTTLPPTDEGDGDSDGGAESQAEEPPAGE